MSDVMTIEHLKAIRADKTDFGAPIYFLTEQQYNYCMWHLEDYNNCQQQKEKLQAQLERVSALKPHLPMAMGKGNPTNGWTFPSGEYVLWSDVQQALQGKNNQRMEPL